MYSQLHVKDGINEPGGCLLGEGNTDFFPQMEILKKHGYEGWIIIENYYNLLPLRKCNAVSYTHLDVYKRQDAWTCDVE